MAKQTLKSKAYETIRHNIVFCHYAPETVITEEMLQSELNISRTPIREAINRLEQEGLVEIKSKKGIVISALNFEEVGMLYETRLLLEPYVIRTYGSRIPQSTYVDLFKRFNSLLEADSKESDFDIDDKFHQLFYNVSQNTYLLEINHRLSGQITRLRVLTRTFAKSDLTQTTHEHLKIVNACLQSSWDEAADLAVEHLKRSRENSFKLILGGKSPWSQQN